jgi:hypothetical protein
MHIKMKSAGHYSFNSEWESGLPCSGRIEKTHDHEWWINPNQPEGPTNKTKTLNEAIEYLENLEKGTLYIDLDKDSFCTPSTPCGPIS